MEQDIPPPDRSSLFRDRLGWYLGISAYWQQVFSGAIIIAAVALNLLRQKPSR